jgi:hypothetical protein
MLAVFGRLQLKLAVSRHSKIHLLQCVLTRYPYIHCLKQCNILVPAPRANYPEHRKAILDGEHRWVTDACFTHVYAACLFRSF